MMDIARDIYIYDLYNLTRNDSSLVKTGNMTDLSPGRGLIWWNRKRTRDIAIARR